MFSPRIPRVYAPGPSPSTPVQFRSVALSCARARVPSFCDPESVRVQSTSQSIAIPVRVGNFHALTPTAGEWLVLCLLQLALPQRITGNVMVPALRAKHDLHQALCEYDVQACTPLLH